MGRKWSSIIIIAAILLPLLPGLSVGATTLNVGDYIVMGQYNEEPILWRCVDINENGPLMLADKILTIKPFDANGSHTYANGNPQLDSAGQYRAKFGSNLWETSNLRAWLNSTAAAGSVAWPDSCPPETNKVMNGVNSYAGEKGFLADGNFTQKERTVIKSAGLKSLLNGVDAGLLNENGTAVHTYQPSIVAAVENYDVAYNHSVTDQMFLLDVWQANKVYQNAPVLGSTYYIGQPTQKAVDYSEYKDSSLAADQNWYSWLRTPYGDASNPSFVRLISADGNLGVHNAYYHYIGVRPAFYLKLSAVSFRFGTNGSIALPYQLEYTYQVTYHANGSTGGTVPIDGGRYESGAIVAVAANTGNLTKNGYRFAGWNTSADGSGTSYTAGTTSFTIGSEHVTLYAQWSIVPYYGDINEDGKIDVADVILAAEMAVGAGSYTAEQILRANVSSKANSTVDISDIVLLVERAAGSTVPFPVELA